MNSYIKAITSLDVGLVEQMLTAKPVWLTWSEPSGKNALHYICGVGPRNGKQADAALAILKFLLKKGMDIDSIHKIPEKNGYFPGTPLWYAYTRGPAGLTALMLAVKRKDEDAIKFLMERDGDPEKKSDDGTTARKIAETKGPKRLLSLL